MTTEYSLKELSSKVYLLDSKHDNFNPLEIGDIKKFGGLKYKILKTEDNRTNGMQVMAVAPVKNNKVDTSEIVIAYAGTNFDDDLDVKTDAQTVVAGSMKLDTSKLFAPADSLVDGQAITAKKFAKEIKADYPNAVIETTGHSLGGFLALNVAAENGWNSTVYNAPDPSHILSDEAIARIEDNPGMLINFRNAADKLGNFRFNGTNAEVRIDTGMGIGETFDAHKLGEWKFDENGQLIIPDMNDNNEARLIYAEKIMYRRMANLARLADRLNASGGGLSTGEKIYLNSVEALLTVDYASQAMQIGLESVIKLYKDTIVDAEEVWANGIQRAQFICTELSYGEILDALAAGGATKYAVVFAPTAYYREKISVANQIGMDFDRLVFEIKTSITELEKTDNDLASQIGQGA